MFHDNNKNLKNYEYMIFEKTVINTFDYSGVETFTKDVIEHMYNCQLNKRGELFELEEILLGKDICKKDQELILRFYCETPITTIEEDLRYPNLKKEMWSAYNTHGKNSKEYKNLKRELELLDLKLTPEGRQKAIEAVVNKWEVTYFDDLFTNAARYLTIDSALEEIKSEKHKSLINKIRKSDTKVEKDKLKKCLSTLLFNGIFTKRHGSKMLKMSKYLCLDFDGYKSHEEVIKTKEELRKDKFVYSTFVSPKGLGLKVLIKVDRNCLDDHIQLFNGAKEHFSYVDGFDDAVKDCSRACYLSSDPDIYINPDAEIFDEKVKNNVEKKITRNHKMKPKTTKQIVNELHKETQRGENSIFNIKDIEQIKKLVLEYWENKYSLAHGSRNSNIFKLAIKLYCAGVPEKSIEDLFFKQFSGVFESDDELNSIINSACKDDAIFFSQPWVDYKLKRTVISLLEDEEKLNSLLTEKDVNFKDKDIQKELMQLRADSFEFWYKNSDKDGNIKSYEINESRLLDYLKKQNVFCVNNQGGFSYHKIDKNIIYDIDIYDIKRMVVTYIQERHIGNEKLLNKFLKAKLIYTDLFLSDLKIDEPRKLRDSHDKAYKCFSNGIVRINKNKENDFIDYEDLEEPIHVSQIIKHEYIANYKMKSDFETFVEDIAGENLISFKTAIGYLSSKYKSQANAKAIILNDPSTSFSSANGGKGKGIIGKSLSYFNLLTRIDAKQYKPNDSFALAPVTENTDVLFLDDIKPNFHLTDFYNLITDSFEVTAKYKDKKTIPFEVAPKILLSSNYPLKGTDESSKRRRLDLVLTDFYSTKNTPVQKFGNEFFTCWSESEWSSFFNFMVKCVKLYLEKGLIPMSAQSMKLKELIGDTSQDFITFIDDNLDSMMEDYFSLETIKQEYFRYSNQNISARKIKGWLSKWCKYYEYNLIDNRKSNRRVYKLVKPKVILGDFNLKVA